MRWLLRRSKASSRSGGLPPVIRLSRARDAAVSVLGSISSSALPSPPSSDASYLTVQLSESVTSQAMPRRIAVALPSAKLAVVVFVDGVAVVLVAQAGDAEREPVADRQVERAGELALAIVAELQFGAAAELVAGADGAQQHATDGRIAAEQRALRAAQHFRALDVVQRAEQRARTRHVHSVDERADARIDGAVARGADAADRQAHVRRLRAARDVEIGREPRQLEHAVDAGLSRAPPPRMPGRTAARPAGSLRVAAP